MDTLTFDKLKSNQVWLNAFWASLACGLSVTQAKQHANLKEKWEAKKAEK